MPGPIPESGLVLEVRDLAVHFFTDFGVVKAVDGITYTVGAGETLAVVGESGSGKSVGALALLGLVPPPGRITSGSILFQEEELVGLDEHAFREIRGNEIAMIFQDPLTSLNPVFSVGYQIAEVIRAHKGGGRAQAMARATELLELVGIPRASERLHDYPHQFSGGMRQRAMIAMAIALSPALLIADEPTTALDVTVQAQILELLASLQQEFSMGMILITHDLGIVADHADRVAVMYAGKVAEYADVDEVYYNPLHPYSMGLMESLARLDRERTSKLNPIPGHPPSLVLVPPGCPFHPRCRYAQEICEIEYPNLAQRTIDPRHLSACHFAGDLPEPRRVVT